MEDITKLMILSACQVSNHMFWISLAARLQSSYYKINTFSSVWAV